MFSEDDQNSKLAVESRRRFDSEFHVDGPATTNVRPPYVVRRCGGNVSWWLEANRKAQTDKYS